MNNLDRFIKSQERDYDRALKEIKNGHKTTHWIWYIFPQIDGLGYSSTAKYYAIKDINEAKEYINNEYLRGHLIEISNALLELKSNNPLDVMGYPDNLKLKSSMTLFSEVSDDEVFNDVLLKYYNGEKDQNTLRLLNK